MDMQNLKLFFAGDFCPVLRVEQIARDGATEKIFDEIASVTSDSDYTIVDLECPLINNGSPIKKTGPNLKADPVTVNSLKYASVDAVAMANNHIRDYGEKGLLETIELCHSNSIDTIGVGKNLEEAREPLRLELKGRKLSILNLTENEWSNTYGDIPGANPLDLVNNYNDIQKAKNESDIVIVVFHGGNEFYELPGPRVKKILRFFVEAGASAIVGHHTHVSSGYEIYKGVPIFYSLGNFCYDAPFKARTNWHYGYGVKLSLSDKIEFELIPFIQNAEIPGVHLLHGEEKTEFLQRIDSLNKIISDDKLLEEAFDGYCDANAFRYDQIFEPYHSRVLVSLRKRGLFPSLITKRRKRLLLNIIRCDAHRDVLMKYLNRYDA